MAKAVQGTSGSVPLTTLDSNGDMLNCGNKNGGTVSLCIDRKLTGIQGINHDMTELE